MLRPCNECGREISVYAKTCPHCGVKHPFKSDAVRKMDNVSGAMLRIGCAIPVAIIGLIFAAAFLVALAESC